MSIDNRPGTGLDSDLAELRAALARHPFPSTQDHILAWLVARREPALLLWRVAALSREREYDSVDAVCAELVRDSDSGMPPPPGR
jgi:hypothetical protein